MSVSPPEDGICKLGSLITDLPYDPLVANCADDPYPLYRRLVRDDPVHRCATRDLWVLSRFDDVDRALRDCASFSSVVPFAEAGVREILFTDPPLHDRLRAVVRDRFRAPAVAALGPTIRSLAARLRRSATAADTPDLATGLAWPIALTAVSELIGVPPDAREHLLSALQRRTYPSAFAAGDDAASVQAEADAVLVDAFEVLIESRLGAASDDLIGDVAAAVTSGAVALPEAIRLVDFLFEGLDTAANLLASALRSLIVERPAVPPGRTEQVLRALAEELIRFDSPIQGTFRVTTREVRRHGVTIPAHSLVYLLIGAANRDPGRYDEPDRLLPDRTPSRLLAFGTGTHVCPGAPLARLVLRHALPSLLELTTVYDVVAIRRPANDFTRAILELRCRDSSGTAVSRR